MADIFAKCRDFNTADFLQKKGLYPYFAPLESAQGPEVICGGRKMIMAGSNNYLGLAADQRMKRAAAEALEKYGTGGTGSRILNGNTTCHDALEAKIARFKRKEAGLVYATGYQMNTGTISALAGKTDFVIVDKLDHASILDGARLSGAAMKRFRHNDPDDLNHILSDIPKEAGKLVVVDGVFSMEGDICDLPNILGVVKQHKARIIVDDAHATGVLGKTGRGSAEYHNIDPDELDLVVGTCSKTLASVGGFCTGKRDVIKYIRHHSRSMIFSAAPPVAVIATISKALDIVEEEPERRDHLWKLTEKLRDGFQALGFDTGNSATPIVPVMVRDNTKAFMLWRALFDAGIFTNPVVCPAVPPKDTLVRVSLMATHTAAHVDAILEAFDTCTRQVGLERSTG